MDALVVVVGISIIIVLGSIGNIISTIVWRHGKRCQNASCGSYIWSLALNDLFLLSIVGGEFVLLKAGIRIRHHLEIVCKVLLYCGQIAPQVSAWITVAVALERMLYVCFPIRMYQSNVKRRSFIVLCLIVLFSFALNSFELIEPEKRIYQIRNNNSKLNSTVPYCVTPSPELGETYYIVRAISYGIFTFLLPLVIISTSNAVMLIQICFHEQTSDCNMLQRRNRRNIRNITRVVACISILHCISTFPYAIFQCRIYVSLPEINEEFMLISYFLNSGFNFVVYCLFGSDFRQDLKELFNSVCCHCHSSARERPERRSFRLRKL